MSFKKVNVQRFQARVSEGREGMCKMKENASNRQRGLTSNQSEGGANFQAYCDLSNRILLSLPPPPLPALHIPFHGELQYPTKCRGSVLQLATENPHGSFVHISLYHPIAFSAFPPFHTTRRLLRDLCINLVTAIAFRCNNIITIYFHTMPVLSDLQLSSSKKLRDRGNSS